MNGNSVLTLSRRAAGKGKGNGNGNDTDDKGNCKAKRYFTRSSIKLENVSTSTTALTPPTSEI
jgi:hypothetical protein